VTVFPVVQCRRHSPQNGAFQELFFRDPDGSPVVFLYEKGWAGLLSVAIWEQTGGRTADLSGLKERNSAGSSPMC